MRDRQIGKTELHIHPLGFGAGPIGDPRVTTREAIDTVEAAWRAGVRLFDTAPFYGLGRSERRLGVALADLGQRADYCINTKVGRTLTPEPDRRETNRTYAPDGSVRTPRDPRSGFRVQFSYAYDALAQQHQESLQRLGTAHVDCLTIHDIDYGHQSWDQLDTAILQLSPHGGRGGSYLEEQRAQGRIKAIGAGCNREMRNYASWLEGDHEIVIERLFDAVDLDFLILAGCYTLLDTVALRRVLPLCEQHGASVIIASPYAGGWLAAPQDIGYMYGDNAPEAIVKKTLAIQQVCSAYDVHLPAVALQFALAHPQVSAVIPGAKTADEVQATVANANVEIPVELWGTLKEQDLLDPTAPTPTHPPTT